jgi:3-methyladenine DNA glycosylase AlkD
MKATEQARQLVDRLTSTKSNLTQIRTIATECGKNQAIANELWKHGETSARLLALLILEKAIYLPIWIESVVGKKAVGREA